MGSRIWRSGLVAASLTALLTGCAAASVPRTPTRLANLPGETTTSPCSPHRVDLRGSNLTLTREFENRLLGTFPRLPGATRVTSAPVAALRNAPATMMSSNLVTTTGWWTSSGDESAALHFATAHLPKDFQEDFTAGSTLAFRRRDTQFATAITVQATFEPYESGVVERIDIQAIYWPVCPNLNALIPNPTGATVLIERPNKAAFRRTVGRGPALKLVAVLKTLPPALPVTIHCPVEFSDDADIVSFKTARSAVTVIADISGCPSVSFEGHPKATLSDWTGVFNAAVLRAIR